MSEADIILAPDYSVTRSKAGNVLRGRVESAREYLRQKAAPQRLFDLIYTSRPTADWQTFEQFRLKHITDFFSFHDIEDSGRYFSCRFNTEPVYDQVGNQAVNMKAQLIEAVGEALFAYPSFASGNPSVNIPVGSATDLGGSGKQFLYAGYGFRVNGSFSNVFLDETDVTGSLSSGVLTSVALGLHRARITGGPPTSLDYLI